MNPIRITMMAATLFAAGLAAAQPAAVLHGEDSGSFHFSQQRHDSALTRAEVVAHAAAARQAGVADLAIAEDGGSFHLGQQTHHSLLTRADVIAEMLAARQSGEMAALTGEDSGAAWFAAHTAGEATRLARRADVLWAGLDAPHARQAAACTAEGGAGDAICAERVVLAEPNEEALR